MPSKVITISELRVCTALVSQRFIEYMFVFGFETSHPLRCCVLQYGFR